MFSWLDASLAVLGDRFIRAWSKVEHAYRRPSARLALRLKFAFYPLLAIGAIAWLAWDWTHSQSLDSAEDAIFDLAVQWRPFEPAPSGRVAVVEIDECSIEYFRARGEGGWPWSRQRHADLLDALDRAGVRTVGYDVLFTDPSRDDPGGDQALDAMAEGGAGRFLFASTRLHPDYDAGSPMRASQAPGAFALKPAPQGRSAGRAAPALWRRHGAMERDRQRLAQRRRRAARHPTLCSSRRPRIAVAAAAARGAGNEAGAGEFSRDGAPELA